MRVDLYLKFKDIYEAAEVCKFLLDDGTGTSFAITGPGYNLNLDFTVWIAEPVVNGEGKIVEQGIPDTNYYIMMLCEPEIAMEIPDEYKVSQPLGAPIWAL